jgi:hypothetical protein
MSGSGQDSAVSGDWMICTERRCAQVDQAIEAYGSVAEALMRGLVLTNIEKSPDFASAPPVGERGVLGIGKFLSWVAPFPVQMVGATSVDSA